MNDQERDAMLIKILAKQSTFGVELADNTRKTDQVLNGFPGGDTDGHRRYHENVIEWQELRNRVVRDALVQAGKAGVLGGLGWLAYAIWQSIKLTIKQ